LGMSAARPGSGEILWDAVREAVASIADLDGDDDSSKLERRIRESFRKGVKGLDFTRKRWPRQVNEYADAVFQSLFASLGDKAWLPRADFLLVLDAGVKEQFPPLLLRKIPKPALERTVLAAYERAFEEQRHEPILWEVCQALVQGDKTRKKVFNALQQGLKEASACLNAGMGSNMLAWAQTKQKILHAGGSTGLLRRFTKTMAMQSHCCQNPLLASSSVMLSKQVPCRWLRACNLPVGVGSRK